MRRRQTSVGALLATACARVLRLDACLLDAGSVRANRSYARAFTFANLRAEFPFENLIVPVRMPGAVVDAAVRASRTAGEAVRGREAATDYGFYLQCDVGIETAVRPASKSDGEDGGGDGRSEGQQQQEVHVTKIAGQPISFRREYTVGVCVDLGFGSGKNQPMMDWARAHPGAVPSPEAGRPGKQLVLEYFSRLLWEKLPGFDRIDTDGSGDLTRDEVRRAYVGALADVNRDGVVDAAEREAAERMADILLAAVDVNADGKITRAEYEPVRILQSTFLDWTPGSQL